MLARRIEHQGRCGGASPQRPSFSPVVSFVLRRAVKSGSFPLAGGRWAGAISRFKAGTQAAHGSRPPQRPRMPPLRQSPTQPLTGGKNWLLRSKPWRSIPGALRHSPRDCYILYCGANFEGFIAQKIPSSLPLILAEAAAS